tara:strand:- start:1595 stop:1948 length:354 start_codon:yes stop_codon:yes gene_type:complete
MLYDYECADCKHVVEDVYQKVTDDPLTKCPNCGKDSLRRVISGGAYAFVTGGNTIGSLMDKNTRNNKSQIQEQQHKKAEQTPKSEAPWYHNSGSASAKEINGMSKKQKADYIMRGKK